MSRLELRFASVAGVFLGLGYQFQTTGLALTTASKSGFITGLVVVIVPLLTFIPGVRPPNPPATRWPALAGALTAFTGLILLTTTGTSGLFSGIGLGELLTL